MVVDELAVIRANCPNESAGIRAEAMSQPTSIPAYSPHQPVASLDEGPILIPGDDLGATEKKLDGITSQENAIDGGQFGRNPIDIVCPYCNLPKIFSVNQHIRDGSRFGLCPLMPKKVSVKMELKQEATKRLSNLIVVSVPSSNKQRCGYCGLLVGTVLQDSADGTILSPHEKFQDDELGGKLSWYCPVAPSHPPEKYQRLKQEKDARERARQDRKNAWKRERYQEKRRLRHAERKKRIQGTYAPSRSSNMNSSSDI
ncbi:hypothetical protein Pmar_PMAR014045 [Perkinsus marinus ATCC 50983]|uniref:Uncharacterized protein n=1 Tax=Perkinsus marinus (strain ATCC 50983 / TXsc) TaxID=423536 RepID=C5KMD3_PERM5|nr:hypothetical protein Pmar_PMAR014045 [Perkinsus marinus ATCC 50983]EER14360.1 hypothetical protein Pmar_PMAR014045 [Perkinsus marinus ATCC 50983]|eukprot:XP_002782565.1 hypothetical protein Pmar_PMAR014045 [Perkinsus marinus ATCC 50983]